MSDAKVEITADNNPLLKAIKESQEATKAAFEHMKASIESLNSSFEKMTGWITRITAVLAGGSAIKEFTESTLKWGEQNIALSRSLGISSEKATAYQVALQHLGIGADVMLEASDKVSKQIFTNSAAFEKAGIETKQTNGQFRSTGEVLQDVFAYLNKIHDPIERNIAGMNLLGKGWSEFRGLLKLNDEAMASATIRAKELGLATDPEQIHEYVHAMRDSELVVTALKNNLGKELLPALTSVASAFSESGPKDLGVFGSFLKQIAWLAGELAISFEKESMWIGKLAAQATAFVHGDFAQIGAIQKDFEADLAALEARADGLWDKLNRPPPEQKKEEKPDDDAGPHDFDSKEKDASRVSAWETVLQERKAAYEEEAAAEGELREYSKQQEITYWQSILATTKTTLEERKDIRAKVAAAELAIDKARLEGSLEVLKNEEANHGKNLEARLAAEEKYADAVKQVYGADSKAYADAQKQIAETKRAEVDQERELDNMRSASAHGAMLQQIQAAEEEAKERYSEGAISISKLVQLEQQLAESRYEIKRGELIKEASLADPDDPIAQEKIYDQLRQLANQHSQEMLTIDKQLTQQEIALSKQLTTTLTQGMAQAFDSILLKQQTLAQAFKKLFDSMLESVLKFLAEWAAKALVSEAQQLLANKAAGLSAAGLAAANAGASAAAIPIVGWTLAPGVMASTFAEASGFASAAGGYEIPSGLNPMTQLHEQEMVLPRELADRVRAVTPGPGGGGGANINLSVNTINAKSFRSLLKRGGVLEKELRDMHRRGTR